MRLTEIKNFRIREEPYKYLDSTQIVNQKKYCIDVLKRRLFRLPFQKKEYWTQYRVWTSYNTEGWWESIKFDRLTEAEKYIINIKKYFKVEK